MNVHSAKRISYLTIAIVLPIAAYLFYDLFLESPYYALRELAQRGVENSPKSFLVQVAAQNVVNVELLLQAGIDVNTKSEDGLTAMMLTAITGNRTIAMQILSHGYLPGMKNQAGLSGLCHDRFFAG